MKTHDHSTIDKGRRGLLAHPQTEGQACGKAILIGEHSAVEGYPAIALPLKDQSLRLCFGDAIQGSWESAWLLFLNDQPVALPDAERHRLTLSLEEALRRLTAGKMSLADFSTQQISIHSSIPLGAGMGGSAALSAALVRALAASLFLKLTNEQVASMANELDCLFHGRASGLDAATVVSDSIICFQKGHGIRPLRNQKSFWLLLVDTMERTPTREMVARVAGLRERNPQHVHQHFVALSRLVEASEQAIVQGNLVHLGQSLHKAHSHLQALEVSTSALDQCVEDMCKSGALGAKLTGGGGGGLALGIFENRPSLPLNSRWANAPHFLTFVPAEKNS